MRASKLRDFADLDNDELDEITLRQDGKNANGARVAHEPLTFCDLSAWARRELPEREWAVLERFPLRNVGLVSAEGSVGMSILIMQVGAAHVLGKDWAQTLPEPSRFLYFNAEGEEDELYRQLLLRRPRMSRLHSRSRSDRDWKPAINTSGAVVEVGQLRARALVS